MSLLFALLLLAAQATTQNTAAPPPSSPTTASQNATPRAPVVPPSPDPASAHFTADVGLLLVAIKPTATADYEAALQGLQEALSKDTDANRSAAAKGWRVFKAAEPDAKGNALYIHLMMPTVTGFDYRPSLLLDELIKELAPDVLSKYQDAFAMPPTRLNLTEFAKMSVAPVTKPKI